MTATISIEQDLAFDILELLRLGPIYALLGTEHEGELGDDFKPHKWQGYEMEHAESLAQAHLKLLAAMDGQITPAGDVT